MSAWSRYFAVSLCLALPPERLAGDTVREQAAAARTRHRAALLAVASSVPEADAKTIENWIVEREPDRLYLFPPHDELAAPGASTTNEGWHDVGLTPDLQETCRELRRGHSAELLALASRAVQKASYSLAWDLVHEALYEDPDSQEARRMLGYEQIDGVWRRAYVAEQLKKGFVWDDRFGWILSTRLPRYEQGQRYYNGRWIAAGVEANQRRDIQRGWRIFTENFEVRTNLGEQEAVQLARRLERLFAAWRQAFGRFFISPKQFESIFAGRARAPGAGGRRSIVYFRTRDEYNAFLQPSQPRIAMTLGIYFDRERTAFFFGGPQQDAGTVLHEATHQLFQEVRRQSRPIARRANFWAVEAAACYMESLADHGRYLTLGGVEAGRLPAARVRAVRDEFYVPLAELSSYGMQRLQFDRRIAPLYSQSAGLAAFFMQEDESRRRDAFCAYLADIYAGSENPRLLPGAAEASFQELDRAYLRWIAEQQQRSE